MKLEKLFFREKLHMVSKNALCIFMLLSSLIANSFGQQKDFGTSLNVGITYKRSTRSSFDLSQMSYFNNNSKNLWFTFTDASVNLKHDKHFSSEFHVRAIAHVLPNESFQNREMIYFIENFQGRIKKLGINFDIKSRWQYSAIENHWNDSFKGPYLYHRFRLNIEKPFNYHLKASFSTEFFEPINRPTHSTIDQVRYTTSLSYRLNKNWTHGLSLQTMQQIGAKNPYLYTFLGYNIHYTF